MIAVSIHRLLRHVGLALLLLLAGCGSMMRNLGEKATDGAISSLGKPESEQRLKRMRELLLNEPELRELVKHLAADLGSALTDAEMQRRVDELLARVAKLLSERGGGAIAQLLRGAEPELKHLIRDALQQLSTSLRDAMQRDLTAATQKLAANIVDSATAALEKELKGSLGKSLEETAARAGHKFISEGMRSLGEKESQQLLSKMASDIAEHASHGAVLGARAGVREVLPDRTQVLLMIVIAAMGVLLLLVSAGLIYTRWQYKRSSLALRIVAKKVNGAKSPDLKQQISESAQRHNLERWLADFLHESGL